jgi:hypothetical protein
VALNLTPSEQLQLDNNPQQRAYFEALSQERDYQQALFAALDARGISINDATNPEYQAIATAVAGRQGISNIQSALLAKDYPGSPATLRGGIYWNDPSGLGTWFVPPGKTPQEALGDIVPDWKNTLSPALVYSIVHNPDTALANGGQPARQLKALPLNAIHSRPKIMAVNPPIMEPACDDGYFYDEFNDWCLPLGGGGQGSTEGLGGAVSGGGAAQIHITVNNAVNLAEGVGQKIADAVSFGIEQAVDQAKEAASEAANAVTSSLKDVVDAIGDGVKTLLGSLKDGLVYIADLIKNNVGALIDFIVNNVGKLVSTVTDVLNNVIVPVLKNVNDVITKVNDVITNTIAPIFNTISHVYQQTVGLIDAIKRDISNGIQGILQLPSDIANSLTGLEATLQRVSQQLSFRSKDGSNVTLDDIMDSAVGGNLRHLGSLLTTPTSAPATPTTYADLQHLWEPDVNAALGKAFDAIWSEIVTFFKKSMDSSTGALNALKSVPLLIPFVAEAEWSLPAVLIGFALTLISAYKPALEFIEDDVSAKMGLSKLSPNDALAAWVRRFIEEKDLREELAVNGWDASRIQVLMDLQKYLIGIEPILDMWHRGIVTANDLDDNLDDHALIGADRTAVIAASYKIFDPGLAGAMFLRGLITEQQLFDVLKVNRYTQPEQEAFKTTLIRPGGPRVTLDRIRNDALVASRLVAHQDLFTPPTDFFQSAQDVGTSSEEATEIWRNSFPIPPLHEWLGLYFRGLRTRSELDAAFDYFRILPEWRDDFIRVNQALIPFRTIPAMLAGGIISEPYAKQQLQAHGFDLAQIDALLKYAGVKGKTSKTKTAQTINDLSLATVKEFWVQGVITDDQYQKALVAHGYAPDTAALQIKVELLAEHAKERKTVASGIVDEALAGLITDDQAQQQLAQQGFTLQETAKYLKQLRTAKRANAKLPSEAELVKFLKAGLITVDDFQQALKATGYAPKWVEAFTTLNFKPATVTLGG